MAVDFRRVGPCHPTPVKVIQLTARPQSTTLAKEFCRARAAAPMRLLHTKAGSLNNRDEQRFIIHDRDARSPYDRNEQECIIHARNECQGVHTLRSMTRWKSGAAPAGMRVKKFSTRFSGRLPTTLSSASALPISRATKVAKLGAATLLGRPAHYAALISCRGIQNAGSDALMMRQQIAPATTPYAQSAISQKLLGSLAPLLICSIRKQCCSRSLQISCWLIRFSSSEQSSIDRSVSMNPRGGGGGS